MAKHDKEIFKAELAGTIDKEIFKAQLKGEPMLVNVGFKLIIPLVNYTDLTEFVNKVHSFDTFEWSHNRMQNGTLCYAGYPVLEKITEESMILWDGWRIYSRNRSFMKCTGWVETNENHGLSNAFNYFVPLGVYGDGGYIEVTKAGGDVTKHPLPEYNTEGKFDNGFVIDTTYSNKIEFCHPPPFNHNKPILQQDDVIVREDLIRNLGLDKQYLATKGNAVRFPAAF